MKTNHNITLIGTIHKNKGICTYTELCKIIESINPEVIFEEKPPTYFDEYYTTKTRSNLESDAINLYLENHKATQVLVDYNIIPDETFFSNNRYMHFQIEKRSRGYRAIIDTNSNYIENYGFNYLNSIECLKSHESLDNEIEETLKFINQEKLFPIRKAWLEWEEKRDNAMMINIYKYCKSNIFKTGLFLIGTAHRKSIIEKISEYNKKYNLNINWHYNFPIE